MSRLLSLSTLDGQTVQYPLRILQCQSGTIADLFSESFDPDDQIELPFTRAELEVFFELLATEELPPEPLSALRVADYLNLNWPLHKLERLLTQLSLDNIELVDGFLKQAGYPALSFTALIYLLQHRAELMSFTGPRIRERFDHTFEGLVGSLTVAELQRHVLPALPSNLRHVWVYACESFPPDHVLSPELLERGRSCLAQLRHYCCPPPSMADFMAEFEKMGLREVIRDALNEVPEEEAQNPAMLIGNVMRQLRL